MYNRRVRKSRLIAVRVTDETYELFYSTLYQFKAHNKQYTAEDLIKDALTCLIKNKITGHLL